MSSTSLATRRATAYAELETLIAELVGFGTLLPELERQGASCPATVLSEIHALTQDTKAAMLDAEVPAWHVEGFVDAVEVVCAGALAHSRRPSSQTDAP